MPQYGFSPNRILPYKARIEDSVLIRAYAVGENQYSVIFYTVATLKTMGKRLKIVF